MMSKSIRTTHKLAISTFAIARQLSGNDDIKRSFDVIGLNILQNVAQYICALTVYFSNKDGELSKEEESLIINYLSTVQGLDIDLPKRNQLKWAEEILFEDDYKFTDYTQVIKDFIAELSPYLNEAEQMLFKYALCEEHLNPETDKDKLY
jgi:hypothetical protein